MTSLRQRNARLDVALVVEKPTTQVRSLRALATELLVGLPRAPRSRIRVLVGSVSL